MIAMLDGWWVTKRCLVGYNCFCTIDKAKEVLSRNMLSKLKCGFLDYCLP